MIPRISVTGIAFLVVICNLWWRTHAELFTAISEVEPLLETHKRIIDDLDHYIQKEEERLFVLKKHLNDYKREHDKAMEDIPNYLGNPINAFTLIKRLTTDLDYIELSINKGTEYIKNVTMNHQDVKYPTLEDLSGAAHALTRLQKTYQLNVGDLAEGVLNGVVYSTPMTAGDCYELGKALYLDKDYRNALAWMKEALRKFKDENTNAYLFTEIDILEYIGFSHYLLNEVEAAMKWTLKVLELDPNHNRALNNIPHYKKSIEEAKEKLRRQRRGDTGDVEEAESVVTMSEYALERAKYEALCRGEKDISEAMKSRLFCRYLADKPFLKMAPIKMEQKYIDPDVYVFHKVITDEEIEYVKEMAKPRFKRAVVHDPKTGQLIPAHYRISKSSWIKDFESPVITRISQRAADFSGLDMSSAEDLQVVNYGIGGHYEPHYDFARKQEEKTFAGFSGNRIATVLFYMSDVAQGGATVFTELGVSVFPEKGSALYWMNLHPSGEGDLSTRHAACPVLRGSKWVCNKWVHQGGQEFLKPCNLEYQAEAIIHKLPTPVAKSFR